MRTVEELLKEKVDRNDMTTEEVKAFNNYWFKVYEAEGFSKVYCSPFDVNYKQYWTSTTIKRNGE